MRNLTVAIKLFQHRQLNFQGHTAWSDDHRPQNSEFLLAIPYKVSVLMMYHAERQGPRAGSLLGLFASWKPSVTISIADCQKGQLCIINYTAIVRHFLRDSRFIFTLKNHSSPFVFIPLSVIQGNDTYTAFQPNYETCSSDKNNTGGDAMSVEMVMPGEDAVSVMVMVITLVRMLCQWWWWW